MRAARARGSSGRTRGRTSNHLPTITTPKPAKPVESEVASNTGVHIPTLTPAPWQDQAACAGIDDPEIFFPTDANLPNITIAQAICDPCPVKMQCRQWAFDNNIHDGIWGGLTEQQRFLMLGLNRRRDRRAKLKKRETS